MSPTRMPCPPPVTCWTCCCRKTPAQAPAQQPLVQDPQARGPLAQAPAPTAAAPLAPAAPVSRFLEIKVVILRVTGHPDSGFS